MSASAIEEVGASMDGEYPKPIDPALLRTVNRIVIIGNEAKVEPVSDMVGTIET